MYNITRYAELSALCLHASGTYMATFMYLYCCTLALGVLYHTSTCRCVYVYICYTVLQ